MNLTFSEKIIYGAFALGIGFPIMGIMVTLQSFELSNSFNHVFLIHKKVPALFLIDLAPIILPLVAYYVTILTKEENKKAIDLYESNNLKLVSQAILSLQNTNENKEFELGENLKDISVTLEYFRKNLLQNKKEEEQRLWESNGIAKFGEILRNNSEDLDQLSKNTIKELCKYTGAQFGGFYYLDDSRKKHFLNLTASYAYDFTVKQNQKFDIGEGLVGQCFKNKEFLYFDNIPDGYEYNIESGLGNSSPSCLLFSPLISHNEVVGVLEISSLNRLEEFKIDFIKKLSDSLAISMVNAKNSQQTKDLLDESQFMSEQLQSQEEELRQNAEELQATQEEIKRKLTETESILESEKLKISSIVKTSSDGIIVISENGGLLDYNPSFQNLLEYSSADLKSNSLKEILNLKADTITFVENNLDEVIEHLVITKNENEVWVKLSINKMISEGKVSYSMFVSDISELKHNINVMEETVTEFQNLMMEQAEAQGALEIEVESLKQEIESLKK